MAEQQYVIFQLEKETYGIDIAKVWEIITPKAVTKVPHAASFIEGIINLRGKVIPVIDLRKRFGLSSGEHRHSERIVIIEIEGNTLGMTVDGVSEVLQINTEAVEAPPSVVTDVDSDYLAGVAKLEDRLIILLNLDKVLTHQEKQVLGEVC